MIHQRVRDLEPSATLAINELSDALIANGQRVYKLGLGQSPFPVPEVVYQAIFRSLQSVWPWSGNEPLSMILGDGEIVFNIVSIGPEAITATVEAGDCLTSRKGITVRGIDIDLAPFSPKDERDLEFCLESSLEFSFHVPEFLLLFLSVECSFSFLVSQQESSLV